MKKQEIKVIGLDKKLTPTTISDLFIPSPMYLQGESISGKNNSTTARKSVAVVEDAPTGSLKILN